MTTVPEKTKEIVLSSSFYRKGIAEGLINLSSLARVLKPRIEKELMKNVSEASIVMALKRLSLEITYTNKKDFGKHLGDITLKSGLVEFTYKNSENLYFKIHKLLKNIDNEVYLTFVKGVWQTTIIASKSLSSEIIKTFQKEALQTSYKNLSSITVKLIDNHIEEPGIMAFVLDYLAWEGVNIIEVVSTFDELTIIINDVYVSRAFEVIKDLKSRQ